MKSPVVILIFVFATLHVSAADMELKSSAPNVGEAFDLQSFIERQIETGTNQVIIRPGRYRVTPKNGAHLSFQNLTNLDLVAKGVEMVCTEIRPAIVIRCCRNFHLDGMTIDYDPLPMTEGRIVALAPDKSWMEFQIIDGYAMDNLVERIEIYDPATKELRRASYYGWGQFKKIGPERYRISKDSSYAYNPTEDTEQVGDIFVTNHSYPGNVSEGHAVELSQCAAVELQDITLYASPCFGFLEDRCESDIYRHCVIDRRSPASDPVKRGFPRMRSLNADAFHSVDATEGPQIINCTARFMGDDAVNIHGRYALVTASTGTVLRLAAPDGISIAAGDPVEFLPFEGQRPSDAVVKNIDPDSPITSAEQSFVEKLGMTQHIKESLLAGDAKFYRVTLDRPVALPMGSLIAAANRLGSGFLVKGCNFGYNRSRGVLIKASHGQVLDNTITHSWMAGVLVSPEFWWMEAGSASDVTIAGNKIIDCRQTAIQVVAPGGDGKPLMSGAHHDITISNNIISNSIWPNIRVTSSSKLTVRNNQLTPASEVRNAGKTKPISIENCSQVELQPLP